MIITFKPLSSVYSWRVAALWLSKAVGLGVCWVASVTALAVGWALIGVFATVEVVLVGMVLAAMVCAVLQPDTLSVQVKAAARMVRLKNVGFDTGFRFNIVSL